MPSGIRKGLTPARILEEAFAVVDGGGAEALTMRALAKRLNVAAMALYNHFHDREAILDALAEQVFAALPKAAGGAPTKVKARPGGEVDREWKAKLRKILTEAHRLASRHPFVYRLAMTRPNKPASAHAVSGESIRILCDAGASNLQAQTIYQTFVILLQGYPFWREGYERHLCASGANIRTADKQFTEAVNWLLDSVELLLLQNARAAKKKHVRS